MKRILTIALALIVSNAWAQLDRTKLPEPSEAKEIKIGNFEKFTLKNGLKVILVENNKVPTIGWTLTFDIGTITEGDKSGYLGMFGQVMRAGTQTKTKEVLDEEVDFMGASVSVGSRSVSAFSLSKYKEEILDIMTDVLYNPAFPEEELEKIKKQTISGLVSSKDNPNAIAGVVSSVLNYGKDHTYGEITTEETVGNITIDDLKSHYAKYFKPNVAYLIIVGDINKKDAQKMAKKYFGDWQKGDVQKEVFEAPKAIDATTVAIIDRPSSVQSVINITYPIDNKPGSADVTKLSILNQILGGGGLSTRLNSNLREDKGYTYGANSSIGASRYSATFSAGASVRNEVTDSAMTQFIYELERLRNEPVDQEELDLAKNSLRGSFARSLESRATVAQFALNGELNNLPKDYYANYLKRLDAITVADIQDVAQRYLRPDKANIVVVGKAAEIAEKLKPFGEVKFFDDEGNPVDDPTVAVVSDVSPQDIITKYIEALGGAEKLDAITSIQNSSKASVQGFELTRKVYFGKPDKYADVQVIPGQGEVKQVYNAGNAHLVMGGQKQALPAPTAAILKYLGVMFVERFYEDFGYSIEYKGIKKVGGKDAHRLDVNIGSGQTVSEFYDVESGLKVRMELGGQIGTIELSDYKEVEGVMIYHSFSQSGGALPVKLTYVSSKVIVNAELDDSVFN